TGTGASGEIRLHSPRRYSSSIASPRTRTCFSRNLETRTAAGSTVSFSVMEASPRLLMVGAPGGAPLANEAKGTPTSSIDACDGKPLRNSDLLLHAAPRCAEIQARSHSRSRLLGACVENKMSVESVEAIRRIFGETAAAHQRFAGHGADRIAAAAETITRALRSGHKVLSFGNGGSASDAEHLVAELVGRFEGERRGLAGVAVTGDSCNVT